MATAAIQTRADAKQRTRRLLMRTGMRLFARHGIAAVRMGDVARAARVAHGTVFLHFATRDALVAAVIKDYAGRTAMRIRELVERGAGVRHVLEAHVEGLRDMEGFYARLVTEGPSMSATARTALIGIQSAVSAHLADAIESEIRSGRMRRLPLDFVFNAWLGLVNHYVANRDLFAPGESVLRRRGPELVDQFLNLLKLH